MANDTRNRPPADSATACPPQHPRGRPEKERRPPEPDADSDEERGADGVPLDHYAG
ncbi:hypothetical protein [Stutzerimonas azotifigens]|uniref:hypothetical protein n=1 Tax=Stutzerimonas azotifigens TaxID=291995 RepID=UPI0013788228|nr:hypothetical protein [Stutzerimonas azotifigens]